MVGGLIPCCETAMILRVTLLLAALLLGNCSLTQRELSDDEWCKSFEYRAGTRGNMSSAANGSTGSEPEQPKQDEGRVRSFGIRFDVK
jgi:hypothetical protein